MSQPTIPVPADQPAIQAGINAAVNGDTVPVAPGTYSESIAFKGEAITVTSSGGRGGPSIKFVDHIFDANATPALDCGSLQGGSLSPIDEAHQSLFDQNLL